MTTALLPNELRQLQSIDQPTSESDLIAVGSLRAAAYSSSHQTAAADDTSATSAAPRPTSSAAGTVPAASPSATSTDDTSAAERAVDERAEGGVGGAEVESGVFDERSVA